MNVSTAENAGVSKVTLYGGTFSKIGVAAPATLVGTLAEGYGFRKENAWVNQLDGTELTGVTVQQAPIETFALAADKTTADYGEEITLTTSVGLRDAKQTATYQWFKDGKLVNTTESSYVIKDLTAGDHKITCTVSCDGYITSKSVDLKVNKADCQITPPTAKENLVYTGKEQALITAGKADGGTMQYCLTQDGAYSENVPTGKNTGSYTVWYQAIGDSNHNDSAPASVSVTIARQPVNVPESDATVFTYDGKKKTYTIAANDNYTVANAEQTNAGTYTVTVTLKDTENFVWNDETDTAKEFPFVIAPAKVTVTIKDKSAYVGSKTAPDLSNPEKDKDYTVDGLIGEDHLIKAPALSYDPATPDMTKIGEAAKIIANGADAGSNYSITYVAGKLTLSRRSSSSGSVTYPINVPDKTENGSVTVSPKNASKGDTVTVTVKSDSGYVLETISVTDKNGNDLKLTDKGNGKYTFTMPTSKVEVKAIFMEDNSVLNFFYDVPNDAYYFEAVKWAAENGITGGVGNSLFAPNQPCTRAQIVTFLWRAAGSPEPKNMSNFSDVPADSYYAKAVAWAVENGITTGTGDGKFSPDATCTRAQSVTFLFRASKASANGAPAFSDVAATAYYAEAVKWATDNGITNGIGDNLFGSDNDCTRAQIVTFLYRMYQEN